jgi:integrase/recombinase XerD
MKLKRAISGFILTKEAEISHQTIKLYSRYLDHLSQYLGDPNIEEITETEVQSFFLFMKNDYIPARSRDDGSRLSGASLDNIWISIRSFFSWSIENNLLTVRPDRNLKRPRFEKNEVEPFTQEQIQQILYACMWTTEAKTTDRKSFRMKRPTADRDKAIVLTLLDTGVRLGELCRIQYKDLDLENGEIKIRSFSTGIKSKPRSVFLGKAAKKALWIFISSHDAKPNSNELLFNLHMRSVQSIFRHLSERVDFNVHAHKFRHSFAIQFLRNSGDVFSLKRLLGHSNLTMVMHYLKLAESDDKEAHRNASPVDRWKL